jgi:hypothetical protein
VDRRPKASDGQISNTYFREIANNMATPIVTLGENIEKERFNVVVEGLMVQEEFSEKTEILTIYLVLLSVHFEHRKIGLTINLISWRVS